jgi:hypothetical protein
MNDSTFVLKLYSVEIIFFLLMAVGSVAIGYGLKKYPEKVGLKKPVAKKYYLACLVPFIFYVIIFVLDRTEGLSFPTGIAIHQNVVLLHGTIETIRERQIDEVAYSEFKEKLFLYDAHTGNEIKNFPSVSPLYIRNDRMLGTGVFGYHVIELETGAVLEILSDEKIRERLTTKTQEKIFSLELNETEAYFNVRTVLDNKFT